MQVGSNGDAQRVDLLAADAAMSRNSDTYTAFGVTSHFVNSTAQKKKKKKMPFMIVAAAAGGALLLIVLVVVVIVLVVRHKKKQQKTYDGSSYVVDYVMMLEQRMSGTSPNASPRVPAQQTKSK